MSAPEAIVALLLGLFLVHLGLSSMARVSTAQSRLASRTDALVAMRVARHVLRRELSHGLPGEDWWAAGDSLAIRAFRGTAAVCPYDSTATELVVSYGGDRRPDPSKDSVLLLDPEGGRTARRLVGLAAATGPCASTPTGSLATWRFDADVPAGIVVARLFERGSYHLGPAALRYRSGASGRQPLTPEVWAGTTAWSQSGPSLRLAVQHLDSAAGPPWSVVLSWMP